MILTMPSDLGGGRRIVDVDRRGEVPDHRRVEGDVDVGVGEVRVPRVVDDDLDRADAADGDVPDRRDREDARVERDRGGAAHDRNGRDRVHDRARGRAGYRDRGRQGGEGLARRRRRNGRGAGGDRRGHGRGLQGRAGRGHGAVTDDGLARDVRARDVVDAGDIDHDLGEARADDLELHHDERLVALGEAVCPCRPPGCSGCAGRRGPRSWSGPA